MSEAADVSDRSLTEIGSIVRTYARWIVLTTLAGAALAAIITAAMPPVYRVDLSLVAGTKGAGGAAAVGQDLARILGTWVYVLSDSAAFDQAASRLAERYDAAALRTVAVAVHPVDNSMVIVATVRAGTPELAADFAQALLDAAGTSELARPFPISPLGMPPPPSSPEFPRRRHAILLGGAAGLLLGTALAFLFADLGRGGWKALKSLRGAE